MPLGNLSGRRRRPAPVVSALAAFAALALVASACGGGGSKAAKPTAATQPPPSSSSTTGKTAAPTYPLTGRPVDDAGRAGRPALVVKIDNAPQAWPQVGLGAADVIYEEVVEGGITRFLAVFQSTDAGLVGPVRSVRPIDPAIVTPLGGLFAYSGGAPKFQAMIRKAPVQVVGFDEASDAYHRDRSRKAPHNLFTTTQQLWAKAGADRHAPAPLFTYAVDGRSPDGPNEKPLNGFTIVMGQRTTVGWDWDAGAKVWRRTTNGAPHVDQAGAQLGFDNVVLQLVQYRSTGDLDVGGNHVPEADIVGSGNAFLLADGKMIPGRWSKPDAATPTRFTDEQGGVLELKPGRTFVEFMPLDAATQSR
jgi:hypothetical protein